MTKHIVNLCGDICVGLHVFSVSCVPYLRVALPRTSVIAPKKLQKDGNAVKPTFASMTLIAPMVGEKGLVELFKKAHVVFRALEVGSNHRVGLNTSRLFIFIIIRSGNQRASQWFTCDIC